MWAGSAITQFSRRQAEYCTAVDALDARVHVLVRKPVSPVRLPAVAPRPAAKTQGAYLQAEENHDVTQAIQ
jgi:hypothetical protein